MRKAGRQEKRGSETTIPDLSVPLPWRSWRTWRFNLFETSPVDDPEELCRVIQLGRNFGKIEKRTTDERRWTRIKA
jgi:hypothetical protein